MPFLTQPTDSRETLARPFNVLGCTLEGNQLRHCAAKPIVQVAIIANTSGFYTSRALIQGPTEQESDALPTEPLRLIHSMVSLKMEIDKNLFWLF